MDQSQSDSDSQQTQSSAGAAAVNGEVSGSAGSGTAKPVLKACLSNSTIPGSPKVQFGAGTKDRDGSVKGVKRMKRTFKDIVKKEVMTPDGEAEESPPSSRQPFDSPSVKPRSILKSIRSEPILQTDCDDFEKTSLGFTNKAYEGDSSEDIRNPANADSTSSSSPITKIATTKNSAKFPLLQPGVPSTSNKGFSDLVDLLIQRSSIDLGGRDMHPFGRDCSIEGIMQASRPKSHSKNSAFGKLVIWLTLLSFLLGAACGIIFLSETYNLEQREKNLLLSSTNSSNT